jgi:hypothetical protein
LVFVKKENKKKRKNYQVHFPLIVVALPFPFCNTHTYRVRQSAEFQTSNKLEVGRKGAISKTH